MGLSNNERYTKTIWAIRQMRKLTENKLIKDDVVLLTYLNDLWPKFLQNESDSFRWFAGSSSTNEAIDENSLFGAAICIKHEIDYPGDNVLPDYPEGSYGKWHSNFLRDDYISILNNLGVIEGLYAEVYELCGNIIYALRRYNDEFRASYKEFDDLISQIRGHCFDKFCESSLYKDAWLLGNIVSKVFTYKNDDFINLLGQKQNLHHDLQLNRGGNAHLFEIYKAIQFKELSHKERLEILFKLLGHRYHYQHQFNEVLVEVREFNRTAKRNEKIPINKLTESFKKCQKKKEENDKKNTTSYEYGIYCDLTGKSKVK